MNSDNPFMDLPPLRSPRKVKAVPVVYRHDIKLLYQQAHEQNFKRMTPLAYESGHYFKPTMPDVLSTNGTTRYIEDVINFLGHHAERVNTMGIKTKTGWRRSGGTNGSTDVHCEIKIPSQAFPVGWKIEIKNKDTMLKGQIKYQAKMQRVGVLHSVIRVGELDLFWDEYYRIIKL